MMDTRIRCFKYVNMNEEIYAGKKGVLLLKEKNKRQVQEVK